MFVAVAKKLLHPSLQVGLWLPLMCEVWSIVALLWTIRQYGSEFPAPKPSWSDKPEALRQHTRTVLGVCADTVAMSASRQHSRLRIFSACTQAPASDPRCARPIESGRSVMACHLASFGREIKNN